jgi:hypothetical protein
MSNSHFTTLMLCRAVIFSFKKVSWSAAPSRSSSTKSNSSRIRSLFKSSSLGVSVLLVGSPISTGITTYVPYVSRKGFSPVVECGVVW